MSPQTGPEAEENGFIPNGTVCPDETDESVCLTGLTVENGQVKPQTKDSIVNVNDSNTATNTKDGQQPKPKKKKVKLRISKTVCLYMCFLGVGLATNILGPTLTNMREFLNTDTEHIVWAFSGSIVGWIGGSVVAALVYERFNPELQLTLATLVMCLTTGLAPWTGNLYGFILLMSIQGLGAGFIDAAGQPYGLRLWEGSKKKDPVMQATQLFLSIGSCVGPLIINPFLVEVEDHHKKNSNSTTRVEKTDSLDVSVHVENSSVQYNSVTTNDWLNSTTNTSQGNGKEMLVGWSYVMFSAVILLATILFFVVYLLNGPSWRVKKSCKPQSKEGYHPKSIPFKIFILVMLFLFFFLLMWISGLGHLIPALVTDGLDWEVHHGSLIAALFWGMLGVGRVIGIPMSTKMSPAQMVILDTGLAVVALALMSLVNVAGNVIMWISAALAGIATATEFVSGVLWASKYINFNGAVAAVCITGMGTGGIAGVSIAGVLFDRQQYLRVIYFSLGATIAHFLLFIFMHVTVEAWYKRIQRNQPEAAFVVRPASVELKPLKLSDETDPTATDV